MPKHHKLSRREFLKAVGATASAAMLGACTPQTPAAVAPTATAGATEPIPGEAEPTATAPAVSEGASAPTKAVPTPTEIRPITPEMVLVEAGSFEMGSTDGLPDEQPVHTVKITRPFYIGKYEVTFEEYDLFYYDNPGTGIKRPGDEGQERGKLPVCCIPWYDAVAYCNWLSEKEGLTPCYSGSGKLIECDFSAGGYRLPTEAEWEYAARGGQKSKGYIYAGSDNPDDVAWYSDNSDAQPHPVGQKQPNELGLYDVSGNQSEWCWDWYDEDYYASSPDSDPTGSASARDILLGKVKRSGGWTYSADHVRTTFRDAEQASYPGSGFRLVRTA